MEETLIARIGDAYLNPVFKDGEVLLNTDLNEIVSVVKTGINENYYDIQKIQSGAIPVGNASRLDGASLSKFVTETLQNDDNKVPTAAQVKAYVDSEIAKLA